MVTTKGTGLNPNAKVWQEIPAHENGIPEGTEDPSWLQTYTHDPEMSEGYSDVLSFGGKECDFEYPDSTDYSYMSTEGTVNGIENPDLGYLVFDSQCESAVDGDVSNEQPLSGDSLRESLKKQLEFCFSRENLSKDLYLISQMDSDQFVPIWTIACMEDVKALTTDMDLILEVLQESPLVQVDETGEKVRPNYSRSIIILREVPETTPVEEVESLFTNDNCPKVLSVEFAHNSNWYITFQSDMDALQAYRYLREEVKVFQGKPIMARIKAFNTFFGKNGFRSVDSSVYSQSAQPQAPYSSPVYMQQVYSPQQQYPVYPVVSPSWNPPVMPYFETPLAPFANSGFINGYGNHGNYQANPSSVSTRRPMGKNRNHAKGHLQPVDVPLSSLTLGTLMDGLSGSVNSQPLQTSGTLTVTTSEPVSLLSLNLKDHQATIHSGDLTETGRSRRGNHRGMRRKREDDHTTRPVPGTEVKVPPQPKFDLEASSFPPLPGCVVSVTEETTPEGRCLSDVVRGLKVTNKTVNQAVSETKHTSSPEASECSIVTGDRKPSQEAQLVTSVSSPVKEVAVKKAESPISKATVSSTVPAVSPAASEHAPPTSSQPPSADATTSSPLSPTSEQGQRKLSYAEVCQRLAKDPPAAQTPSPPPPASSDSQPLQELKVNRVEEPRTNSRRTTNKPEKPGSGPPRRDSRSYRGPTGSARSGGVGLKSREHQRGLNIGKQFSPQRGARRSGKEQNIPPRSPQQ
ncbi:la-related protein 4 [Aulostomus maculatus]